MKNERSITVGRCELISTAFAAGWCELSNQEPVFVHAMLRDELLGVAEANLIRPDLEKRKEMRGVGARAFLIVFRRPISENDLNSTEIIIAGRRGTLPQAPQLRFDRMPKLQVFLLGSPRSGTSQLGSTISDQFNLPWLGEGHGAPLFSEANHVLDGKGNTQGSLIRFMTQQHLGDLAIEAAQRSYYFTHSSASFLDKTPGLGMINATPFLMRCFPSAKFIYIARNGISNVLSRMEKFGGRFEAHCADWAAAVQAWERVRGGLPYRLELRQEQMEADPAEVGKRIASFLDVPDKADAIEASLANGSLERTGAGRGRMFLEQTGWNDRQVDDFIRICGPAMNRLEYCLRQPTVSV